MSTAWVAEEVKGTDKMKADGFTNVYNLEGGFKAWVKNGFETTKP